MNQIERSLPKTNEGGDRSFGEKHFISLSKLSILHVDAYCLRLRLSNFREGGGAVID